MSCFFFCVGFTAEGGRRRCFVEYQSTQHIDVQFRLVPGERVSEGEKITFRANKADGPVPPELGHFPGNLESEYRGY